MYTPDEGHKVFKVIKDIRLVHGAAFIGDVETKLETLVNMLHLLSAFVYFDGNQSVDYKDSVFMSLPAMLIKFAYHSRIDSGYRLLERCLRHCFDMKMNDLTTASVKLIRKKCSGKIGISFKQNVHASMKNDC